MTQWLKSGTRRACIFVRHACISGVLLAVLAGCNGSDEAESAQGSTFETVTTGDGKEGTIDDNLPVTGTVKEVAGTKHEPQTDGGEAISLDKGDDGDGATVLNEGVKLVAAKTTRFTEIAPDTTGGATYRSSSALEYDLGNLVASTADAYSTYKDDRVFITPVRGWLRYPQEALNAKMTADRFPVIVFLHGNHVNTDPSYQGYDYLAEDLATHGYVALSIDANWINYGSAIMDDSNSQSRAQLILGTLDRLRQIGKDGGPGELNALKGKLDFNRVGIMGHSRGGQGVSNAIKFNQTRRGVTEEDLKASMKARPDLFEKDYPELAAAAIAAGKRQKTGLTGDKSDEVVSSTFSGSPDTIGEIKPPNIDEEILPAHIDEKKFQSAIKKYNIFYAAGRETVPPYDFKGAFMLAPTDFEGNLGVNNVPLANLLPSCDGDVSNLQGAWAFDHNRFGPLTDIAPRYQIMVKGANHNFYNTVWTVDDYNPTKDNGWGGRVYDPDTYCSMREDGVRLNGENQRRGGLFIMNSFMRYHVGGEQKFAAYWNGLAQMPAAACSWGQGTCDERVALTVQKDAERRKRIQRFEPADSMERNELGDAVGFSGFDAVARCDMALGGGARGDCSPDQLDGFGAIMSMADHAQLVWSKPSASFTTGLAGVSAKNYDSLTFRIAVVRPMGQEVMVTLTDSAGKTATVTASDFSDALYNAPRPRTKDDGRPLKDDPRDAPYANGQVKMLLNMVAIPLKAFVGVDTTSLKELKLVFPKESGKVAITDIEFQNLGREKPVQQVAGQ